MCTQTFPDKTQSAFHLAANICNISVNTHMKWESTSFFNRSTEAQQTYPCIMYRLSTNDNLQVFIKTCYATFPQIRYVAFQIRYANLAQTHDLGLNSPAGSLLLGLGSSSWPPPHAVNYSYFPLFSLITWDLVFFSWCRMFFLAYSCVLTLCSKSGVANLCCSVQKPAWAAQNKYLGLSLFLG
jgi:hypothetical protein